MRRYHSPGFQCRRSEAIGEAGARCGSGATAAVAAAVLDGMSREAAAQIGAMDRQTLRDRAHRFNAKGPEGLINAKAPGPAPKLSPEWKQELKRIVEAGPDPVHDGVARWRCVDLGRVIKERFDVDLDEVTTKLRGSGNPLGPTSHTQRRLVLNFGPH